MQHKKMRITDICHSLCGIGQFYKCLITEKQTLMRLHPVEKTFQFMFFVQDTGRVIRVAKK